MKIYPAIDIINGQVVRLFKGKFSEKTIYNNDPVAVAQSFEKMGAKHLHLVDLDGAKLGKPQQTELLKDICASSSLKVQIGGGIRKVSDVMELLSAGAQRVVIGSLALENPALFHEILREFGGKRITLAVDLSLDEKGHPLLATKGWQELSPFTLTELLEEALGYGLDQILCTDISRDGTLAGVNLELYEDIKSRFPGLTVLASGGVKCQDDLNKLRASGIDGAIIGKSIYEGKLDLKEALKC